MATRKRFWTKAELEERVEELEDENTELRDRMNAISELVADEEGEDD